MRERERDARCPMCVLHHYTCVYILLYIYKITMVTVVSAKTIGVTTVIVTISKS